MTDSQGSEVDVQVDDVLKLVEDFSRLHWKFNIDCDSMLALCVAYFM